MKTPLPEGFGANDCPVASLGQSLTSLHLHPTPAQTQFLQNKLFTRHSKLNLEAFSSAKPLNLLNKDPTLPSGNGQLSAEGCRFMVWHKQDNLKRFENYSNEEFFH